MTRAAALLCFALVLPACGAAPAPGAPAAGPSVSPTAVPTAQAAPPASPDGASKGKGKGKGKGAKATGAGRFSAQPKSMCTPDCRLLTVYSFDEVQANYCALCGAHDEMACTLDWPTSDVPSCEIWDYYRNCIYATYGRPFEKEQWKAAFRDQPWYRPDPGYSDAKLSAMAKANVEEAQRRKAAKVMCAP